MWATLRLNLSLRTLNPKQGVGDTSTDPQMNSSDGQGYGQGKRGQRGITEVINLNLSGN